MRGWVGCAVLLMWTCFFTANALRSRRTHSIISAPVYLLAAALLAGNTWGFIAVDIWMVWVLGAGIIAANLAERFIGSIYGLTRYTVTTQSFNGLQDYTDTPIRWPNDLVLRAAWRAFTV